MLKLQPKMPGVFLLSLVMIALLGVPIMVSTQCPICGGTGVISGLKGTEIKEFQYRLVKSEHASAGCDAEWENWTYSISVTLENKTKQPSYGYINITAYVSSKDFYPSSTEDDVDGSSKENTTVWLEQENKLRELPAIPVFVSIPPETVRNVAQVLTYKESLGLGESIRLAIGESVETECPYCMGKGTVSLIEWAGILVR